MTKVKIVCTIGPSCSNYDTSLKMARAGMNVARFNFSHGEYEGHQEMLGLGGRWKKNWESLLPPCWIQRGRR